MAIFSLVEVSGIDFVVPGSSLGFLAKTTYDVFVLLMISVSTTLSSFPASLFLSKNMPAKPT